MDAEKSSAISPALSAIAGTAAESIDSGLGLVVLRGDEVLHDSTYGGWNPGSVVHAWSSAKWFTATAVLAVVDHGRVALDDPVVAHVPWFARDDAAKEAITLRQCLSLTTGLAGSHPSIADPSITLEDSVRAISAKSLAAEPGAALSYGGDGFQVAGYVAEVVCEAPFLEVFGEMVAGPCRLEHTVFSPGPSLNPWLGGGLRTSLGDLTRFVSRQQRGPQALLSDTSMRELRTSHTTGLAVTATPYDGTNRNYGLGVWLDETDEAGNGVLISSQGAAGCTPWVDDSTGTAGAILTEDSYLRIYSVFRDIVSSVRGEALSSGNIEDR